MLNSRISGLLRKQIFGFDCCKLICAATVIKAYNSLPLREKVVLHECIHHGYRVRCSALQASKNRFAQRRHGIEMVIDPMK